MVIQPESVMHPTAEQKRIPVMKQESSSAGKLAVKLKEAAAMLSVSTKSLRRRINSGDLKVSRAFRHIVIPISEIERFLRA